MTFGDGYLVIGSPGELAAAVLAKVDDYYADQRGRGRGAAAQLMIRQLGDACPKDASVTRELDAYRNLTVRWTDWGEVRRVCRQLSAEMLEAEG